MSPLPLAPVAPPADLVLPWHLAPGTPPLREADGALWLVSVTAVGSAQPTTQASLQGRSPYNPRRSRHPGRCFSEPSLIWQGPCCSEIRGGEAAGPPQPEGTFQHKPRVPGRRAQRHVLPPEGGGNETHREGTAACPSRRGAGTGSSRSHAALCCCRGRTLPPHWTLDPTQKETRAGCRGGRWMGGWRLFLVLT